MKEQEPQLPGFIEGLGIKSALWFEGKLDNRNFCLNLPLKQLINSKKVNGVLRLPIEIEYLEPEYLEKAKRL